MFILHDITQAKSINGSDGVSYTVKQGCPREVLQYLGKTIPMFYRIIITSQRAITMVREHPREHLVGV